jgi:heterodisulfide reductase subunit B
VPVIHLVQLIGLAFDVEMAKLGFDAHAISFKKFLEKFNSLPAEKEVHHG